MEVFEEFLVEHRKIVHLY